MLGLPLGPPPKSCTDKFLYGRNYMHGFVLWQGVGQIQRSALTKPCTGPLLIADVNSMRSACFADSDDMHKQQFDYTYGFYTAQSSIINPAFSIKQLIDQRVRF